MSLLDKLRRWLSGSKPLLPRPDRGGRESPAVRVDELPPFSLRTADLMRFDPQVRMGLAARNGLLLPAVAEAEGGDPEIAAWVTATWRRIWTTSAAQLLKAKLYGFLPLEVMYRRVAEGEGSGRLAFDRFLEHHPKNVRLLQTDAGVAGFALRMGGREMELLSPKALVCTFDAEFGNPYGCALLERAYPAWHEKWMEGGAKKLLRLRMIKDSYLGDIFWYPADRQVTLPGGEAVSWRDLAREVVESRMSGGALTLPLAYDAQGRKLIDYTPPRDVAGGAHIFAWKREVDLEIWKALEMPPEVIEAATTGSGYAGRSIPFTIALGAMQMEFQEIVRCVDRDVLRPLAWLNFGEEPQYELRIQPLVETFAGMKF